MALPALVLGPVLHLQADGALQALGGHQFVLAGEKTKKKPRRLVCYAHEKLCQHNANWSTQKICRRSCFAREWIKVRRYDGTTV